MPVVIRPYHPSDARAVCAFFASAHRRDREVREVAPAAWKAYTGHTSVGGGRDFAVALEGDRVVGLLVSIFLRGGAGGRPRRHFRIVVHPCRRRRGIGGTLFRFLEEQPIRGAHPLLQTVVPLSWKSALRFYRRRGFRVVGKEIELRRPDRPVPAPRLPAGYSIRPFGRAGDVVAWLRVFRGAFRDSLLGAHTLTASEARSERALPGARSWMAVHGRRPVGICLVHRADGRRYVQTLAVEKSHRGRGLARALLRTGVRALRQGGRGPAAIGTESENPARRLYESEGFRVVGGELAFWRDR